MATVAVVVLSLGVLFGRSLLARWGVIATPARYSKGDRIEVPPAAYAANDRTLVLFSRSTCPACQAAKIRLATLVRQTRSDTGIGVVFISDLDSAAEREFAADIGIAASGVISLPTRLLRGQSIPAVALVNRQGIILYYDERVGPDWDARDTELGRLLQSKDDHRR